MALDSNVMTDLGGLPLPHFTPHPSPRSSGVNVFAQDVSSPAPFLQSCYAFPPLSLVGALIRYMQHYQKSFTLVVLDIYPRKYWWALIQRYNRKAIKLASKGHDKALLKPSKNGWVNYQGSPADLWAFAISLTINACNVAVPMNGFMSC